MLSTSVPGLVAPPWSPHLSGPIRFLARPQRFIRG